MNTDKRALTRRQAEAVWQILVDCCGASRNAADREGFVQIMSSRAAVAEWRFDASCGFSAVFRFPDMSLVNVSEQPTNKWVAMVVRANTELRYMVPAGIELLEPAGVRTAVARADDMALAFA
ncbi:hypothetical protein [Cupriavidus sp. TMH.W2]|uniref:hypothetical protein n=1 Tax=Cupriavidus sp. TMH.W2 TaxID=3434465 RepID=UPI003D76ED81